MPDPIRFNLATLGQLQRPVNPGIGWVGPERPAESWADVKADPLSALFDVGRGAVTGDAPKGMNLQGLGALIAAVLPFSSGKAIQAAKAADLAEATEAATVARLRAESAANGRTVRQILTDPRLGGDDAYLVTARTLSPVGLQRERFRVQQRSEGYSPSEVRQHLQWLDQVEQERAAAKQLTQSKP